MTFNTLEGIWLPPAAEAGMLRVRVRVRVRVGVALSLCPISNPDPKPTQTLTLTLGLLAKLIRHAALGLAATCVSDCTANSIRVRT